MNYREQIDRKTLLNILDIGINPYSMDTLYVCSTEVARKRFEEKYKNVPHKIVLTKREIYSTDAIIGLLYSEYKFVK